MAEGRGTLSYTDGGGRWGEAKEKWAGGIALLRGYQVNAQMMALTGNLNVKFLHLSAGVP